MLKNMSIRLILVLTLAGASLGLAACRGTDPTVTPTSEMGAQPQMTDSSISPLPTPGQDNSPVAP